MRKHTLFRLMMALMLCSFSFLASAGYEEDAQAQMVQGNFEGALEIVDQGLQQNGENRDLLLAKGYLLIKLNRLDEAARYFEKLRVVLKNDPTPVNNLAMVYGLQKNYTQAITLFKETIRDFPDYTNAYTNLGDTYIKLAQELYQQGFSLTGNAALQQKALLSRDFNQFASKGVAENTQPLQELALPPSPVVTPPPVQNPDAGARVKEAALPEQAERVKEIDVMDNSQIPGADGTLHYQSKSLINNNEWLFTQRKGAYVIHLFTLVDFDKALRISKQAPYRGQAQLYTTVVNQKQLTFLLLGPYADKATANAARGVLPARYAKHALVRSLALVARNRCAKRNSLDAQQAKGLEDFCF